MWLLPTVLVVSLLSNSTKKGLMPAVLPVNKWQVPKLLCVSCLAAQCRYPQTLSEGADNCSVCPGVLCASERSRRAAARVAHDEETQAVARQWRRLQRGLTFDRGIWADPDAPQQYHWKLDKSEDSVRR